MFAVNGYKEHKMKSRNQRIYTDYSKPSSFMDRKPTRQSNSRKLTTPSEKQDYVSRTLHSLNHEVPYHSLSLQQIEAERNQLRLKVKQINAMINVIIARQSEKRLNESRVSKKTTIGQDMGIDIESLFKEAEANNRKIQKMQVQLEENEVKLTGLNDLGAKMERGRMVGELQGRVRELREQLGRMRKNKLMREKEIMKGTSKEDDLLHTLQQDYISSTKKVELITARLTNIQQELADTEFSLQKQKEYYDQLRADCLLIDCSTDNQEHANQEQLLAAYNMRKRKLEISSKRNQKDMQGKKKKYYNLLLQYQELTSRSNSIQDKITIAEQRNEETLQILSKMLNHLKNLSLVPRRSINYDHHPDTELFELTRPQDRPQYRSSFSNKLIVQNQLNKGNARNRSFVRKWKLQGSIVHQNISPEHRNFLHSIHQTDSGEQLQNSQLKSSTAQNGRGYRNPSKQIRHFKTENSPNQSKLHINLDQDEQKYEDDFEV